MPCRLLQAKARASVKHGSASAPRASALRRRVGDEGLGEAAGQAAAGDAAEAAAAHDSRQLAALQHQRPPLANGVQHLCVGNRWCDSATACT